MRLRFLLLFFLIAIFVGAQEPYKNLVITEARTISSGFNDSYLEITNMGVEPIDLSEIKIAKGHGPVDVTVPTGWNSDFRDQGYFYLPESVSKVLQPGESYVMTIGLDFGKNMHNARIIGYSGANRAKKHDIYQYADFIAHREQKNEEELMLYPQIKDSTAYFPDPITGKIDSTIHWQSYVWPIGHLFRPNKAVWLEHHFAENDSAVIDQVKGRFENANNTNDNSPDDVAGITEATGRAILVRKSIITTGNLDFDAARGVGLSDSEWLPLVPPENGDNWRDTWWTVGNHGAFELNENTLEPKTAGFEVDYASKTITVPWGTRRLDDVMRNMEYKPGVAWRYDLNSSQQDSLLRTAQNGDSLTVWVVGETLYEARFVIDVNEPTEVANMVVPVDHANLGNMLTGGPITENTQNGKLGWPRIDGDEIGMDTITGVAGDGYGLPHATRTDSLMKYLEKPSNASWEFVFVDGVDKRADLKTGDILRVTAQNGETRDYFIEVQGYVPNSNSNLSSITWPDISLDELYSEFLGWMGDTIPNFNPSSTGYRIQLPFDYEGIPSLIAKTEDLNASVEVTRATTFDGSVEDRTTSFEVSAEDDTTMKMYTVELAKEKDPANLQPFNAEPFVSEFARAIEKNGFLEIANPGNQTLDLSDYLIATTNSDVPADAITQSAGTDDWMDRYDKYIPGYKWVSEVDWSVSPGMVEQDLSVNSIVLPGDVFLMGDIFRDRHVLESDGYAGDGVWGLPDKLDVQFKNTEAEFNTYENNWGEEIGNNSTPIPNSFGEHVYLFKILNDSIKQGLKPATDPNDFELIDALVDPVNGRWVVAGDRQTQRWVIKRKPEIIVGNPVPGESFGATPEDSEWEVWNTYYVNVVLDLPGSREFNLERDLGQHFFKEPTSYISTVTAVLYKVSKGYSHDESIEGVVTGTTTSEFLSNIYKADEGQSLMVKATADGSELAMDATLSLNDTLVVLSADSTNTTKYVLNVSEDGLSSNAVITSEKYTVEVTQDPQSVGEGESVADSHMGMGTVTGMEYGAQLSTIINNIDLPAGARLTVIDGKGAYVPFKMLNFDTTYVSVSVNSNQYLEVVAENGITTILYQLLPQGTEKDAQLFSDIYDVDQNDLLVSYVPRGTAVAGFLSNVVVSTGASVMVVDKFGMERTEGNVVQDDRVVVTSADGTVQTVYFLSMLATEFVPETTYLAYVTSRVYTVDQLDMEIAGATASTELAEFYGRITPALGATAIVVDSDGTEKTTGDLDDGDMVKVVSADGKIEVMYTLNLDLTSADMTEDIQITLYPNPTSGKVNVSGVTVGGRIQVFNSMGANIRNINVQQSIETVSLEDQPAGMYLIVVSNKDELLGRFKTVKQ